MDTPTSSPELNSGGDSSGNIGRRRQYTIETKQLRYELPVQPWTHAVTSCKLGADMPTKPILRSVTCEARPGEVTAIVGPSGAGKTTLLSILAGTIHPAAAGISGMILVNGRQMPVARFRRVSGYVTQDDSLFPLLTVRESLLYSARLRIRGPGTAAEGKVTQLLKELGLERVSESRVGGGISGGERRRVSIGVELVHDPAVLLLDEPTSGLDSASALHVVSLLKNMASPGGRTVVLTIHQPGFRILELLDRVVLISSGTVRHNDSLAALERRLTDAGHRIPARVNVLEYAMDAGMSSLRLPVGNTDDDHFLLTGVTHPAHPGTSDLFSGLVYANSHASEVAILSERCSKNTLRTNQLFMSKVIQALFAGVGLGSIFINVKDVQSRLGFFAFTLTFLLSCTTEGLPVFLQERAILERETRRGAYRVSSYVVAGALVALPFLLLVALLYSFPVYWMVGLRREVDGFLYFSLVIWMVVLMANSFVAFFSALVPNFIMGNSLIAGVMGAYFLFSGYFITKDNIPKYWIFMHYLSLFKYPFEAFLVNQYGSGRGRSDCIEHDAGGNCTMNGAMFLKRQGLDGVQRWSSLVVMAAFILGYRLLCFLVLWVRCYRIRR